MRIPIKPSEPIAVTIVSKGALTELAGYQIGKGGAQTVPTDTLVAQQARAEALKEQRRQEKSSVTRDANKRLKAALSGKPLPASDKLVADKLVADKASKPKASKPQADQKLVSEEMRALEVRALVAERKMAPGEAAIRLAKLANPGLNLDQAIVEWHIAQVIPEGVVVSEELKMLSKQGAGLLASRVVTKSDNPLAANLAASLANGQLSKAEARKALLGSTRPTVIQPEQSVWLCGGAADAPRPKNLSNSARVVEQVVETHPNAIAAKLARESDEKGRQITVTFSMVLKGATEEQRVTWALEGEIRRRFAADPSLKMSDLRSWKAQALQTWQETGELPPDILVPSTDVLTEGVKTGKPPKMVAWAVNFLGRSGDANSLSVHFNEGTVLTVLFDGTDKDKASKLLDKSAEVKAIYGQGSGIALTRVWFGQTKTEGSQLRAVAKGHDLLLEGMRMATFPIPEGKPDSWRPHRQLERGEFWKPGFVKPGQAFGVFCWKQCQQEDGGARPAVFLYQKVTGFTVTPIMTRAAITQQGPGMPVEGVESTLSVDGRRAGQVFQRKNYNKSGSEWRRHGSDKQALLCPDYRIGSTRP